MAKRKKSKSKFSSNILKYLISFLVVIALLIGTLIGGYYIGYEDAKQEITLKEKKKKDRRLSLLKKIEYTTKTSKKSVNTKLKEVLKKELKKDVTASHEYDKVLVQPPKRVKRVVKKISFSKPKLAIIIDDVSVKSQVKAIKSLNLPLTMSFLPPSKRHPNSAKLASKESFYMVHLPMEAQNFHAEEPDTLRINDSQQKISSKIKEIKKLFPRVKYINNHTGSKYTSNEIAMNRLILAFNSNNISFIDSRTTAKTKAPLVMKNFGLKYIGRDVFLDHHMDKAYVKKQIKLAIKIAKNEGIAIAIGHPHANTIMALYESKKLFKDVDLVYINKIY